MISKCQKVKTLTSLADGKEVLLDSQQRLRIIRDFFFCLVCCLVATMHVSCKTKFSVGFDQFCRIGVGSSQLSVSKRARRPSSHAYATPLTTALFHLYQPRLELVGKKQWYTKTIFAIAASASACEPFGGLRLMKFSFFLNLVGQRSECSCSGSLNC